MVFFAKFHCFPLLYKKTINPKMQVSIYFQHFSSIRRRRTIAVYWGSSETPISEYASSVIIWHRRSSEKAHNTKIKAVYQGQHYGDFYILLRKTLFLEFVNFNNQQIGFYFDIFLLILTFHFVEKSNMHQNRIQSIYV